VQVEIARMTGADRAALVGFVASLSAHDLLFVPRDLGHPKVIDAWMRSLDGGELVSLVAREGGKMVGCTAIFVDELSWSRHVGELRVLVAPDWRGRGLGRTLIQECFAQALELGLRKLVAQMTVDQRSAIALFEELGFRAEALLGKQPGDLGDWIRDQGVVSGAIDLRERLRGRERSLVHRRRRDVEIRITLDNEHSKRYTVLEIVTGDSPGLLYRISRSISDQGCDVDLVLISTEGRKAIDVLHVTKRGRKLGEADQQALRQELVRNLEAPYEAD